MVDGAIHDSLLIDQVPERDIGEVIAMMPMRTFNEKHEVDIVGMANLTYQYLTKIQKQRVLALVNDNRRKRIIQIVIQNNGPPITTNLSKEMREFYKGCG